MSRERTQMTEEKRIPSVVVVGGGYAGVAVAKALDERTTVTLVEPRDAFVHNVARSVRRSTPPPPRGSSCHTTGCSPTARSSATGLYGSTAPRSSSPQG